MFRVKRGGFISPIKPQVKKWYWAPQKKFTDGKIVIVENNQSARIRNAKGQFKSAGKAFLGTGTKMMAERIRDYSSADDRAKRLGMKGRTAVAMEDSGNPGSRTGTTYSQPRQRSKYKQIVTIRKSPVVGDSKLYRTFARFGDPKLSKSWYYIKAIGGVTTGEYRNSQREYDWGESERLGKFVHRIGFNQKGILHLKEWFFNRIDVCDLSGFKLRPEDHGTALKWGNDDLGRADYFAKKNAELRAYLGVTRLTDELTIHNTNSYFPAIVKLHLCCLETSEIFSQQVSWFRPTEPGASEATRTSGSSSVDTVAQILGQMCYPEYFVPGAIPTSRVLTTNDNRTREGVMLKLDPRAYMSMSRNFRRIFKVVKTMTRMLNPNDVWIHKTTHFLPKGINLNVWMDQRTLDGSATSSSPSTEVPIGYFPIIEFYGKRCEAIRTPLRSTSPRALGTSPVELSTEFRNTYEYINDVTAVLQGNTDSQVIKPPTIPFVEYDKARVKYPYVKTYLLDRTKDNITALDKPINFDYESLTDNPAYTGSDRYLIPITTDAQIAYAQSISGNPADDVNPI